MMSASEGVMEKWRQEGKLREFCSINQIHMRTRGEGEKNLTNLYSNFTLDLNLKWPSTTGVKDTHRWAGRTRIFVEMD